MSEQLAEYSVEYTDAKALKLAVISELKRLKDTDAGSYTGPEPSLINAVISGAGWRKGEVADLLRVDVSTIRRWIASNGQSQSRAMPFSAWFLLLQAVGFATIETLID